MQTGMMEALGAAKHGGYEESLEFVHLPLPTTVLSLAPNDVLIEVAYTDTNPVDLQKLQGNKGSGHPVASVTFIPGYGGSGTVLETGENVNAGAWKGQRVCFVADPTRPGSYATHIVVDHRCVALLPLEVSFRDAASIPVAGLTAFESLCKVGLSSDGRDPKSGKSLLVIGGAGGVGSWTISLARAWHPSLKIVATASSIEQHEWCQRIGADRVIRHDEIKQSLPGGGDGSVDAIICLAEPTPELFGTCADIIRPYGSICLVVAGQSIRSLDMSFCFFKCATVTTETVFSSIRTKFQNIVPSQELTILLEMLAEGKLRAPISPDLISGKVHEDFKEALSNVGVLHALTRTGGRRGKFVMKIS